MDEHRFDDDGGANHRDDYLVSAGAPAEEFPFDLEITPERREPNMDNPLVFESGGTVYRLAFERWNEPHRKHPFTTVNVFLWDIADERWRLLRTATVGCYHRDRFTREDGRKFALRSIMKTIHNKSLKTAIWDCYLGR